MPSIYNHDNNACWGIRRASYNIFNEPIGFDVNVDKAEFSNESVNQTVNKIDNFHGSSNGYYGYHLCTASDPNAMDTSNDSEVIHNLPEQTKGSEAINRQIQNNEEYWRRKRSFPDNEHDFCKRTKLAGPEVPADPSPAVVQNTTESSINSNDLPVYNLYRCTMSHYM